jgi:hypothetical protein
MASQHDDELIPEQTAGFVVGQKKTLAEIQAMGMFIFMFISFRSRSCQQLLCHHFCPFLICVVLFSLYKSSTLCGKHHVHVTFTLYPVLLCFIGF